MRNLIQAAAVTLFAASASYAGQATIRGLSSGGSTDARGVSADGSIVVGGDSGGAYSSGCALRWDSTGASTILSPLSASGFAQSVSADGGTAVGWYVSEGRSHPFRWTSSAGARELPFPPGQVSAAAVASSVDGSVIVGVAHNGIPLLCRAIVWTEAGLVRDLGLPAGSMAARAWDVSGDGQVVVGETFVDGPGGVVRNAFRWTPSAGMQLLPSLPSGSDFGAIGISHDGRTIVGYCNVGANLHAVRWTSLGGLQDLGVLPGTEASIAMSVSGDGSVVVGWSGNRAFRWRAGTGMVELRTYLASRGANMAGWNFLLVSDVSADGRSFVGQGGGAAGHFDGGFVASGPATCRCDLTDDGIVGGDDLGRLLGHWGQGIDSAGDLNQDGYVDADDLGDLLSQWGPCAG